MPDPKCGKKATTQSLAANNERFDPLSLIVAPREINVASDHGKILVYELDTDGNRIHDNKARFKETERETSWCVVTGSIRTQRLSPSFLVRESSSRGLSRRSFARCC